MCGHRITFVASANAPLYCGATVDFVDVDPTTNNLCTTALRKKLESASKVNALPKVVIPVHLAGHPCDMVEIQNLAQEFGFSVIEDAAHALGSSYAEHPIGSCKYSDITIFSFHPVKTITTGEGGAATTNDAGLAKKNGAASEPRCDVTPRVSSQKTLLCGAMSNIPWDLTTG